MRCGVNPYKINVDQQTAYVPKEVTVAVLVYIPHLSGYFEQKLEVLN